jgi:hypothetical protein
LALEFATVAALIQLHPVLDLGNPMAKVIAIWGIVAIASAIVAGIVAGMKRRDHSFWAAWSFLFPPMLLILLVMPSNKGPRPRRPGLDELEGRGA